MKTVRIEGAFIDAVATTNAIAEYDVPDNMDVCIVQDTQPYYNSYSANYVFSGYVYINGDYSGQLIDYRRYSRDAAGVETLIGSSQTWGNYDATYNVTEIANSWGVGSTHDPGTLIYTNCGNVDFELGANRLQQARNYFDTPSVPYMDVDVYTQPPIVSVLWDNIDNIPAGMYPSSYYVRLKFYDIHDTNPPYTSYPDYTIALCPYSNKKYEADWRDMLNGIPAIPRELVYALGTFDIKVQLGYIDPDYTYDPDRLVVVNESIFEITMSDGGVVIIDSGDGNTLTPYPDTSPETDDTYDDDTSSIATEDNGLDLSIDNLLTSSFKVTEAQLQSIGADLWANNWQGSLYENQVSPIENIISCKRIPFYVATAVTPTNIYLGNHDTGVQGYRTQATHVLDCGTIQIPDYCGNFLDFTNNISIYLPYCGIHSIPTSLCYKQTKDSDQLPVLSGNTLGVKYYYDILYGTCAAVLSMNGATFAVFNGNCGVDIPMSQSSRASAQLAMDKAGDNMALGITTTLVNAGLSAGVQAMTGNALGAAMTAAHAAVNVAQQKAAYDIEKSHQQLHYTTSGGFSSQVASYLPSSIVLFIDHARYLEPKMYKHENGYPCNLSLVLGNLEGYTELDGSIEISGIDCLEEERALLKQAFCEGFYMQPDPDPSLP